MRTSSVADIAPRLWRRGRTTRAYGHAYSKYAIYWTRLSGDTLVNFRANGNGQGKDGCERGQDGWWWLRDRIIISNGKSSRLSWSPLRESYVN